MEKIFHITPSLEHVAYAIRDIKTFLSELNLSDKSLFVSDLTIEEILTNVIKYSSSEKEISITVLTSDDEYTLSFCYFGGYFDPTKQNDIDVNQPLEERVIGGLGLGMVKKLVKNMSYSHSDSDNLNTLIIKIDY